MKFKNIMLVVLTGLIPVLVMGQEPSLPQGDLSQRERGMVVKNWQLLDLKKDGVFGISMERAYAELLKGKLAKPVVVAVIDGGVDIGHQDLKAGIWKNTGEIAGNGKDDDGNGYIDDVYGWNYMGLSKGSFHIDNTEIARQLRIERRLHPKALKTRLLQTKVDSVLIPQREVLQGLEGQRKSLAGVVSKIGKASPTIENFKNFRYTTEEEAQTLYWIVPELKNDTNYLEHFESNYQVYVEQVNYWNNPDFDPRAGNREYKRKGYGNPDVKGLRPNHGTLVSGVIVGQSTDGTGVKGIAAGHAELLSLRAVPEGDYLEQDMANAIRYAADNGAKVLNISINKFSSPERKLIDDAVRYAMSKDLLIVHASGNEGKELGFGTNFPQREYLDSGSASAWLEVGASGPVDNAGLSAPFSNYGKRVDVYAPGVAIFSSSWPEPYETASGTSFAAPVVAGLAAVIRSYYPLLTAVQVKEIIMKSVVKRDALKEKCSSGGVVNAYEALKLAESYK